MTDNAEQNNANNTMADRITDARNVGKSAVVQQNLLLSAGVSKTDATNSSKTLTVVTVTNNNQVPKHLTQSNLNTPKSTLTNTYTICSNFWSLNYSLLSNLSRIMGKFLSLIVKSVLSILLVVLRLKVFSVLLYFKLGIQILNGL